jgi:transcription elongation GreA/GreB family factor
MALDKHEVVAAVRAQVQADLDEAVRQQKAAHEAATHEEAKPENDKDTRGLEQSYLARGLAKRAEELADTLAALRSLPLRKYGDGDVVGLGALVVAEDDDGAESCYLLAPVGGGLKVEVSGVTVRVVTPESPVGRAFVGKSEGDDAEVKSPKGVRELYVTSVS